MVVKTTPARHHRADPTRAKILKAARKLFVKHGFAGTSIGKIATLAKINHSLIFHHFLNKEKLWVEVKQSIAGDKEEQSKVLPSTELPFKKFLQILIQNSIEFYQNNPDIIRMISWQRLEGNSNKKIGITLSQELTNWIKAFQSYQDKGDINKSLKIEFIITYILSITSSFAFDQNALITDNKAYIEFFINTITQFLQPNTKN